MRRRQCKECTPYYSELDDLTGRVIGVHVEHGVRLSGTPGLHMVKVYTVECKRCRRTWQYRKKVKKPNKRR